MAASFRFFWFDDDGLHKEASRRRFDNIWNRSEPVLDCG
jgi:hypothetical protein